MKSYLIVRDSSQKQQKLVSLRFTCSCHYRNCRNDFLIGSSNEKRLYNITIDTERNKICKKVRNAQQVQSNDIHFLNRVPCSRIAYEGLDSR